ncbi:S-layer homology domain-containing protein [cf. Phormidesmis sp. LEGE 11477]|uniref:S-layer homology domain-containing protein n=1 Tax=cf. Phormidesmis sp. LEGE 11477 TaxID=1828680 RepID=UPI001D13B137|nr:S-layer homology domain-containing protein [cf. Phormidesmis sp. LEGE 11477]
MTQQLDEQSTVQKITQRSARAATAGVVMILGLLTLSSCAGSNLGDRVGQSLEPDPQLAERNSPSESTDPDRTASPRVTVRPATETDQDAEADPDEAATETSSDSDSVNSDSQASDQAAGAAGYVDLDKAPAEIRPYLDDLLTLELLAVRSPATTTEGTTPSPSANEFRPNQATTRREYARWLLAANNRFYQGNPNRRIRPGVTSSQPVFQDVPVTDADFAAIQGLAEAGIIPSPLTGSSTTLTFRPDAPLTRKDLLLWKVPLDTRQPLPEATATAVKQAWSFQDADTIDPRVSQALIADHQLGDFSNIRRTFGYTTLFQSDKAATRAETAAVLWRFGSPTEGITAAEVLNPTASTTPADSEDNE